MTIIGLLPAIQDAFDENEEAKFDFLKKLGEIIGVLANVIQVAGWVIPAASNAASLIKSLVGRPPNLDPAFATIQQEIKDVLHAQHDVVAHLDIEDITKMLNAAEQRLDTLTTFGMHSPEVSIPETIQDTGIAVRNLRSRSFWTRPFFADLVNQDPWIPSTPPLKAADNGDVLDPTLTMAAYPTAISIWMNALGQLEPTRPPDNWPLDIKGAVNDLASYYEEMVSGLRPARPPTLDEMFNDRPIPTTFSPWAIDGEETYGAVDVYTQRRLVARYPGQEFPAPYQDSPGIPQFGDENVRREMAIVYPVFQIRFTLGSLARWKGLYIAEGVHSLWRCVQALAPLAGQKPMNFDPRSSWSIRDVHALLDPVIPPSTVPPLVHVTARDVLVGLRVVLRTMGAPDPASVVDGHSSVPRTSLRTLLDLATP
jgi:hypothetical protein